METSFTQDQSTLLEAIKDSEKARVLTLQDRSEIVVYRGQVIATAQPPTKPELSVRNVETLDSLAAIVSGQSGDVELLVESPSCVRLIDTSEPHNHQLIVKAMAPLPKASVLTDYILLDEALIQLREAFQPSPTVEDLVKILSTTKIEDVTQLKDNGFGINVAVCSRVTNGSEDATVFQMTLTPCRTFPEVEAVSNTFMMRWKRDGAVIRVRLVEQQFWDWKQKQKEVVRDFLRSLLPEETILM